MALNPERHGSGSLNIILAGESPSGLFRIYSSTAKFMIIVMNPWQFALCPSQLHSCYSQGSFSPSGALGLLQSEGRTLQKRKFPSWQKNKIKIQSHHSPPPRKRGGGGGGSLKGKRLCTAEIGGNPTWAQMRAVFQELFGGRFFTLVPMGPPRERGFVSQCPDVCLPLSLEPALFQRTRGSCHFLSQNCARNGVNALNATELCTEERLGWYILYCVRLTTAKSL